MCPKRYRESIKKWEENSYEPAFTLLNIVNKIDLKATVEMTNRNYELRKVDLSCEEQNLEFVALLRESKLCLYDYHLEHGVSYGVYTADNKLMAGMVLMVASMKSEHMISAHSFAISIELIFTGKQYKKLNLVCVNCGCVTRICHERRDLLCTGNQLS